VWGVRREGKDTRKGGGGLNKANGRNAKFQNSKHAVVWCDVARVSVV